MKTWKRLYKVFLLLVIAALACVSPISGDTNPSVASPLPNPSDLANQDDNSAQDLIPQTPLPPEGETGEEVLNLVWSLRMGNLSNIGVMENGVIKGLLWELFDPYQLVIISPQGQIEGSIDLLSANGYATYERDDFYTDHLRGCRGAGREGKTGYPEYMFHVFDDGSIFCGSRGGPLFSFINDNGSVTVRPPFPEKIDVHSNTWNYSQSTNLLYSGGDNYVDIYKTSGELVTNISFFNLDYGQFLFPGEFVLIRDNVLFVYSSIGDLIYQGPIPNTYQDYDWRMIGVPMPNGQVFLIHETYDVLGNKLSDVVIRVGTDGTLHQWSEIQLLNFENEDFYFEDFYRLTYVAALRRIIYLGKQNIMVLDYDLQILRRYPYPEGTSSRNSFVGRDGAFYSWDGYNSEDPLEKYEFLNPPPPLDIVTANNEQESQNSDAGYILANLEFEERYLSAVFSPVGSLLAISCGAEESDFGVKIYDSETLGLIQHLTSTSAWAPTFSPDGNKFAASMNSGEIVIWDAKTWQPVNSLTGHLGPARKLLFIQNGRFLISASSSEDDKEILIWDTETGQQIHSLGNHEKGVSTIAASSDGKYLASASFPYIYLWDLEKFQPVHSWDQTVNGNGATIVDMFFTPNGEILVTNSLNLRFWNVHSGDLLIDGGPTTIALMGPFTSPDGKFVVGSDPSGSLIIWNMNNDLRSISLNAHPGNMVRISGMAFSPDGMIFASSDENGIINFWNTETWEILHTIQAHPENAWLMFSPDGSVLASWDQDGSFVLWDISKIDIK